MSINYESNEPMTSATPPQRLSVFTTLLTFHEKLQKAQTSNSEIFNILSGNVFQTKEDGKEPMAPSPQNIEVVLQEINDLVETVMHQSAEIKRILHE